MRDKNKIEVLTSFMVYKWYTRIAKIKHVWVHKFLEKTRHKIQIKKPKKKRAHWKRLKQMHFEDFRTLYPKYSFMKKFTPWMESGETLVDANLKKLRLRIKYGKRFRRRYARKGRTLKRIKKRAKNKKLSFFILTYCPLFLKKIIKMGHKLKFKTIMKLLFKIIYDINFNKKIPLDLPKVNMRNFLLRLYYKYLFTRFGALNLKPGFTQRTNMSHYKVNPTPIFNKLITYYKKIRCLNISKRKMFPHYKTWWGKTFGYQKLLFHFTCGSAGMGGTLRQLQFACEHLGFHVAKKLKRKMFMDEEMVLINHGKITKYSRSFLKGMRRLRPKITFFFRDRVTRHGTIRRRKSRRV